MKKFLAILLVALLACSIFVACDFLGNEEESSSTPEVVYDLDGAAEYVKGLYKDDLKITSVDYSVVSQVIVAGVTYQIDWAVDSDKVTVGEPANGVVIIGVDEKSPEEVSYTLTATIKADNGESTTVKFKLTVPMYEAVSHEEYMAAQQGDNLTIAGIVVAINSKSAGNKYNHLFIADADVTGGYYCYSVTEDPAKLGIQVGMTVKVTGSVEPYSGMQEIKGGQVAILDTTIKEVPVLDITEQFTAGANLGAYVGLPVTIKGVKIGAQDLSKDTSQYLYFSIGEQQGYVRTYITDFPTTLDIITDENGNAIGSNAKNTIDADHAAHFGYKADVTGILILYNGAPYLIPMSATPFTNYVEVVVTPAEKVEAEKEALNIGASFSEDAVVDLSSTGKYYDDVTITWTTNNETNAAIADGKLTLVVPDDAITVTVTATITCGEVTDTKTFEIALSKAPITIPEALELPDGSNVLVSGTVKEINTAWSDQYGNITVTIEDAEGNTLYVYRMKTNVKVGDIITVKGVMGSYNGAKQVAAGSTATIDDPAPVEVSLTEAVALDDGRRVIVKGTVKEINTAWSEQYGNITVTIEDAEGNTLYIYRLKTNVNVGDVVTISGKVGSYNGSKQIAAGATAVIETGEDNEGDEPAGPVEVTIPEALASEDGVDVIVTGTVKEINTAWSEQYGNITVTIEDAEGNTLYIYRMKTNVQVGAVIKVTGKVGSYNNAKQIAAGATAEIVEAAPIEVSLTEAVALDDGVKVIVKGTVKEINTAWSEQYGNITVTIEDAEGNTLYIYRMKTNVQVGDIVTITGKVGSYNGSKQIAAGATAVIESPVIGTTYTFADYEAGVQYAANEVHKLDDDVTVTTTDAHFTTEIRLYQSEANSYGPARNGYAIFAMSSAVKSLSITAGNKANPVAVYGSTDGENWTLITTIEATSTYTDYPIELGETAYTYIKLAATNGQARVQSITVELQ